MDKYAIYTYEPRRVAMEADWTQENQNSGIDIKDAQSILGTGNMRDWHLSREEV
jgi:hypothetical protein